MPSPTTMPPTSPPPVPMSTVPSKSGASIKGKFDAGGVKLFLVCLGEGSPTVVLDAGWGDDWLTWSGVIPKVQPRTRVCAYDRAGLGQSDKQEGQRTSQQIAEQLHTLLTNAKVDGPYIMVGHAFGGMNMLVFADRYRAEVAGLVLVESAHPDANDRILAALPTPSPQEDVKLTQFRQSLTSTAPADQSLPEPVNWDQTSAQAKAVKTLGSLPLIVLVDSPASLVGLGEWEQSGVSSDLAKKLGQIWLELQKETAALSSDSQVIQAEHSGSYIQNDEPQLVVDAIKGLVDKARQK